VVDLGCSGAVFVKRSLFMAGVLVPLPSLVRGFLCFGCLEEYISGLGGIAYLLSILTLVNPFIGPNPWPVIRRKRIKTLLPHAMRLSGIDAWVVVC